MPVTTKRLPLDSSCSVVALLTRTLVSISSSRTRERGKSSMNSACHSIHFTD
uniref:Actin n=1 Tax=Parascaris univalens TaxID=6257 RepID=A0A914ZTZ8_PARUN